MHLLQQWPINVTVTKEIRCGLQAAFQQRVAKVTCSLVPGRMQGPAWAYSSTAVFLTIDTAALVQLNLASRA